MTDYSDYLGQHALGWSHYVSDYQALLSAPDFELQYQRPEGNLDDLTGYSDGYRDARDAHAQIVRDDPAATHRKVLGLTGSWEQPDTARERDPKYIVGWNEGYQNALADAKHPYDGEPPEPDTDIDPDEGFMAGHEDGWARGKRDMASGVLDSIEGESPEEGDAYPPDDWQETADVENVPDYLEPELVHIVIVIGSYGWTNAAAVQGALHQWWLDHDQPKGVRLITSGCPEGAEATAREFATGFGWTPVIMRDEELAVIEGGAVFAFITERSPGANAALESLSSKVWQRVYRESTVRPNSVWSSR